MSPEWSGDDVKVVYLFKAPAINNIIGVVIAPVLNKMDVVEVIVAKYCYGIHPSNLVSSPGCSCIARGGLIQESRKIFATQKKLV